MHPPVGVEKDETARAVEVEEGGETDEFVGRLTVRRHTEIGMGRHVAFRASAPTRVDRSPCAVIRRRGSSARCPVAEDHHSVDHGELGVTGGTAQHRLVEDAPVDPDGHAHKRHGAIEAEVFARAAQVIDEIEVHVTFKLIDARR